MNNQSTFLDRILSSPNRATAICCCLRTVADRLPEVCNELVEIVIRLSVSCTNPDHTLTDVQTRCWEAIRKVGVRRIDGWDDRASYPYRATLCAADALGSDSSEEACGYFVFFLEGWLGKQNAAQAIRDGVADQHIAEPKD